VADVVVQRAAACLQLADAPGEAGAVLAQQRQAVRDRAVASAPQAGGLLHVGDGHAGVAQPEQELDPGQVGGRVAALAARPAGLMRPAFS
jgi:hypothetical protein